MINTHTKRWKEKHPERVKTLQRIYNLRKKYGLTVDQYEKLLEKQNHSCAICLRHKDVFNQRLSIDHDHVTGFIRGLLCTFCNSRIIGRHRDPERFERAAAYLRQNTGWIVPPKPKKKKKKKRHGKKLRRRKIH